MKNTSKDILLINPNLMKPPVTPLAIDILAGQLKANGYDVRFLDLAFEKDLDSALEREINRDFLFVGLTNRNIDDSFFASKDFLLKRVRPIAKKIRSCTNAPLVMGGVGFSIFPVAALEFIGADYGIQGDGEVAIVQLADSLAKREIPSGVSGMISRTDSTYFENRPAPVDLSAIDLTDRTTVDNPRYLREGGMVGFETKRGCSASCSYCADIVAKGQTCRMRKPEQVAREISTLVDIGITHFQTCDSEFNLPYAHAQEVCQEFIKAGLGDKMQWYAYMAPEPFDNNLALLMKRAGCAGINFGADHSEPALLKRLGRTHTPNAIAEAVRLCHKHGIACMLDLLLGAPGETPETLRSVVDFMKDIAPSCVGASIGIRLYPGTPLTAFLAAHIQEGGPGVYGADADNPSFLRPVFYMSPELGDDPQKLLCDLVDGDERFFVALPEGGDGNFNYNDNSGLSEAIRAGERGTFWDILRRIRLRESNIQS